VGYPQEFFRWEVPTAARVLGGFPVTPAAHSVHRTHFWGIMLCIASKKSMEAMMWNLLVDGVGSSCSVEEGGSAVDVMINANCVVWELVLCLPRVCT